MAKNNITRKLSMKTLGLDKGVILKQVMKDETVSHPLAIILGKVNRVEQKIDDEGRTSCKLCGIFEGENMLSGAKVTAPGCYLPAAASEMVEAALTGAPPGTVVEIGFRIGAHWEESAATSYVYDVEPLIPMEAEGDPLAALKNKAGLLALPAPEKPSDEDKPKGKGKR